MTDYEFVKERYDKNGSCGGISSDACRACPIAGGSCLPNAVYEKSIAWLKTHEKENTMDGIKVTVEEKKVENKSEYPCYKVVDEAKHDRAVVLFTAPRKGIVVVASEINPIGQECDTWYEEDFIPFHGKITIEVE